MNRLLLVITLLVILALIDLYGFQALKAALRDSTASFRQNLYYAYWGISLLIGAGIAYGLLGNPDSMGKTLRTVLMVSVFTYFISKVVLVLFVFVDDLVRMARWGWQQLMPGDTSPGTTADDTISRSQFLAKMGLITAAVPSVAISFGIISGAHDYRVRKRTVHLPHLPAAFDGLTIAQISDVHSGSFWNKTAVQGGVELVQQQKADVLFFTGDLVNNEAREMRHWGETFSQLSAPLGVYSILGNHDYGDYTSWSSDQAKRQNLQDLKTIHQQMGWDLLLNEHRFLQEGSEQLAIVGIENWGTGRFAKYGKMTEAMPGTEEASVRLLLSHDPSHWRSEVLSSYQEIDIAFAGHTHGMQFGVEIPGFRWSPVQYRYAEWADLYRHKEQYLYVNRGFGYIGYPGRIGIPPEITVLTLKKGDERSGREIIRSA